MTATIRLGTSGWSYADWIGPFYPPGTTATRYLPIYAQFFDTAEIDSTFYATPALNVIRSWVERTPPEFVFSAKVPRLITHDRQLIGVTDDLIRFADTMRQLGSKCGPLLLQFAPSFTAAQWHDLAAILPILPTDLRWAIEVRHASWLGDEFYQLLRSYKVALAHVDLPWMPRTTPVTADFAYIRWLGDRKQITENFSYVRSEVDRGTDLDWWARQIRLMQKRGTDVFGYANNHYQGHSPATVRELAARLDLPVREPEAAPQQQSLF